jgi:hypothetical protein
MAQQQQVNSAETGDLDIDYLAINRARWDERAPHVSYMLCLGTCFSLPRLLGVDMYSHCTIGLQPHLTIATRSQNIH